jgi:hypothetical protein
MGDIYRAFEQAKNIANPVQTTFLIDNTSFSFQKLNHSTHYFTTGKK